MNQKDLNNFTRENFDPYKKRQQGYIVHDSNTGREHRRIVNEVCNWAREQRYSFFTRVYLKNGQIADICIPDLEIPFIEVRDSEEKKTKEYLDEYSLKIQFIDVSNPYKL